MSELISRADALEQMAQAECGLHYDDCEADNCSCSYIQRILDIPSADAEQKWNCTASFVAEQLDRLRKMTDEEKWEFFRKFFGMGDAVQGEWIDMEIHCNPYPPIFCVECSRCGYRVGRETFLENTFNFCPSCGARMKGGAE